MCGKSGKSYVCEIFMVIPVYGSSNQLREAGNYEHAKAKESEPKVEVLAICSKWNTYILLKLLLWKCSSSSTAFASVTNQSWALVELRSKLHASAGRICAVTYWQKRAKHVVLFSIIARLFCAIHSELARFRNHEGACPREQNRCFWVISCFCCLVRLR